MAQRSTHWRIRSNSASRSSSVRSLESRILYTRRSGGRTTAPIVRGPAHDPRPTSSIPTTIWSPLSQCWRSIVSDGELARRMRRKRGTVSGTVRGYRSPARIPSTATAPPWPLRTMRFGRPTTPDVTWSASAIRRSRRRLRGLRVRSATRVEASGRASVRRPAGRPGSQRRRPEPARLPRRE